MLGIRIVCPSGVTCVRNQNSVSHWSYMCSKSEQCVPVELHVLGIRIVCPSGVACARNQNSVSEWSYMCSESE